MAPFALQRIALLTVHTCPLATLGGKETGGMNVYVRELARQLGRRGLGVDVFTRSQDERIKRISTRLGGDVRVIHLPAGPERPYPKNDIYHHLPEFVEGVRKFAEADGAVYSVLHSHYWLSGLAAQSLRELWGAPIVHMFHTLAELKNRVATAPAELEPPLRSQSEGEIMRTADRIIAATVAERDEMQADYGADPAKIEIVPPGVDLDLFRPQPCEAAREAVGIAGDHQMVLFVGRIQPIKGIDTLIRAMSLLLRKRPQLAGKLCLTLIGGSGDPASDNELARLQALERELGIDELVTFLGSRDQDTLVDYYNAASVVVIPSHYESFGMVALEAMACGTPVIASDVGGLSLNVADGFNGYLVPKGDAAELAYKIELMLGHTPLRGQLGDQARQWAQRFSWRTIADETLAVYAQAMRRPLSDFAPYMSPPGDEAAWRPAPERECP